MKLRPTVPVLGLFLIVVAFILDVMAADRIGQFCVLVGWPVDAIPAILSQLRWGHAADDSQLSVVNAAFRGALTGYDCASVDRAIAAVLKLPENILQETTLLGTDDKGIVDFVLLSFRTFGWRASSLPWFYFLVLGVSSAAYWAVYRCDSVALALGSILLVCHGAILPYAAAYPQLGGILALRIMPLLGLIAGLHLVLATLRGRTARLDVAAIIIQALIVAFTVQIRFSAVWILVAVAMAMMVALLSRRPAAFVRLGSVIPLAACLILTVTYSTTRAVRMNEAYDHDRNIHGHVLWHSLATGLAFSDKLQREQNIRLDDVSVIAATGEYLKRTGQAARWQSMGGESPSFSDIRWNAYEGAVREMLFDACQNQAGECLKAIFIGKPLALIQNVIWISGWGGKQPPTPHLLDGTVHTQLLAARQILDRQGWNGPFQLWVFVVIAGGIMLVAVDRNNVSPSSGVALAIMLGSSAIPAFAAYPIPHAVGEPVVMSWLAVLSLPVLVFALMLSRRYQGSPK
jgi:hypothetical protein